MVEVYGALSFSTIFSVSLLFTFPPYGQSGVTSCCEYQKIERCLFNISDCLVVSVFLVFLMMLVSLCKGHVRIRL